jgi:mannose-6-phosphate isomerase-like protein (cupin superfamily)
LPGEGHATIISRETAEHYTWGDGCDGWHLVKTPELSVILERMPPGTSEVRHWHLRARQFFFALTGTSTLEIAGARHTLAPGTGAEVPPGAPHQLLNLSADPIEFLVISQPPTIGDREPTPPADG